MATAAAADVSCVDEFDSTQLSEAFDAAMMELQGDKGWFTQLKTSTGYHNAQSVNSCTPGPQWKYPAASNATGLLKRVLESGELRVAGVQWQRGEQADYITDPENPTGFLPHELIPPKNPLTFAPTLDIESFTFAPTKAPLVLIH